VLLHDLCYDSSLNGSFLHLSYTESAYPYKFPVGRLSTTAKVPDHSTRVVERYGLMSQRHPEMDFFINAYLVANSQLSGRGQTSLQSQRRSSNMAVSLLELLDKHAVWIKLYSTGFLPGNIGVLRVVEEILYTGRDRSKQMVVEVMDLNREMQKRDERPVFDYEKDSLLTESYFGTAPEDYESLTIWH